MISDASLCNIDRIMASGYLHKDDTDEGFYNTKQNVMLYSLGQSRIYIIVFHNSILLFNLFHTYIEHTHKKVGFLKLPT
jgi:hypothetical protein